MLSTEASLEEVSLRSGYAVVLLMVVKITMDAMMKNS